ncbi:MAG: DUF1573 domain-containing protein [Muribaculaceae bacterium]|nr:DUF1573 domain-containing protein [Muribaculaceae bacterium]
MKIKGMRISGTTGLLSGIALMVTGGVLMARGEIRWLNTSYDYGVMQEIAGKKTGEARFVNEGPDTTYISYVRPSCGCTDADYTKGELLPGDTATVCFTYNPAGRPGAFEKSVKVYVGPEKTRHVVKISGTVVGSPATLALHYPIDAGAVRLSTRLIDLGDVAVGTGRHAFVTMVNQTLDSITPTLVVPQGLSAEITPERLGPGDLGTLGIYINSGGAVSARSGEQQVRVPLIIDRDTTDIILRAKFISQN